MKRISPSALRQSARLENDPRNGCIGCGPRNPRGLRLEFERVRNTVVSRLQTDETMEGWPDRLHSGVLYIAMLETAAWTIFAFEGRVGIPVRTGALEVKRWVVTGEALTLRGTPGPRRDRHRTVAVESRDARGRLVARIERDFVLPTRDEFLHRMGYGAVPEVYEGLVPSA